MVTITNGALISRGAEAEIYLVDFFGVKAVVKKRVSKPYRNPVFDKLFIQNRTRIEAKVLSDLYVEGVRVPAVFLVDEENGVIVMEYVEGTRLSTIFENISKDMIVEIAKEVGRAAAKMHSLRIFHGDFTLANVLLAGQEVVLIDFGLAGYSTDIEEYAIDLHLMSRSAYAINPTVADTFVTHMFEEYKRSYQGNVDEVLKRVNEIRARGRYVDRDLRKALMRDRYVE